MSPSEAILKFDIPGTLLSVQPIGRGNVNDTYEAVFRSGSSTRSTILQKINSRVFPRPERIMANMRIVTDHVLSKVEREADHAAREWGFPRIVSLGDGRDYYLDSDGEYWRAMSMIDSTTSYGKVRDADHAKEAGTVLGCFHRLISDIDLGSLLDTLPGFHVCPLYLEKYDETMAGGGVPSRMAHGDEVTAMHEFVNKRRDLARVLEDALSKGDLRLRPIHGDPKVDNIMIDDFTGKGIGIIDLDTVKPGQIHYDFGDALRSICNPPGEDAEDLDEVVFDTDLCRAFVDGYMSQEKGFLTEADRRYLFVSVRLLAFELGLRFFQDYLAGDVYFKVRYEEQNFDRARVQFKLCESIEEREKAIKEVLRQSAG